MEDGSRHTFRIAPWRPWLLIMAPLALLAALGTVSAFTAGQRSAAVGILIGLAVVAAATLCLISLVVRTIRWHVDANGIGGRNNWFVYHRLDWSDIESVEPWPIPGYRYVQVNGGGRRWAFWLPMFLTDMPGLRAAVIRHAPPGNPLRRYLEERTA